MVHTSEPMDAVRRTVSRAAKPALAPLRAAAATLHAPGPADGRETEARVAEPAPSPRRGDLEELEELAAMRDELTATPDLRLPEPSDRAARATRSASAYLEARRARLRRELRGLESRR